MSADPSRRSFLHRAGLCGLALACSAALVPADLAALPIVGIEGAGDAAEKSYPLPASDSVSIDRAAAVILVRYQGHAFALRLGCPHQNAAVKWLQQEGRFQCSKHDSKYTPEGTYISGKSTRNLDRFPIRRDGAALLVDTAKVFQADTDPAGWAGAAVTLT